MTIRHTSDGPYFRDVKVVLAGASTVVAKHSTALAEAETPQQLAVAHAELGASTGLSIRILRDQQGHNTAKRLFENYIRGESGHYSRFAEFLVNLDRLISEHGGQPLPIEGGDSSDDESQSESDDEDYVDLSVSDDEDLGDDTHDDYSDQEYASGGRDADVLFEVLAKSR